MSSRFLFTTAFTVSILTSSVALAVTGPGGFTYEGRVYNAAGTAPASGVVTITTKILPPTGTCVLFSQSFASQDLTASNGYVSLKVNAVGLPDALSNRTALVGAGGCNYTPAAGDGRRMEISINSDVLGTVDIGTTPYALYADTLQGLTRDKVLEIGTGSLTQTNAENVFSSTNYPRLTALLAGTSTDYVRRSSNGSSTVPSISGNPAAPVAGEFWYDSVSNSLKYYNGSAVQTLGTSGAGGLTSFNGQTGSAQTLSVTTSGTSPAFSSGANTHTLNIPLASSVGVSAGLISKADYDSFNSKLGTSTTFGGDVTGTSSAMSVERIRGINVSAAYPTNGQVLRFDGSSWVSSALSFDANSISTGVVAVTNGGTGSSNGSIQGSGALTLAAGGTNQDVTISPSGSGNMLLSGYVGIGTSLPNAPLNVYTNLNSGNPLVTINNGATGTNSRTSLRLRQGVSDTMAMGVTSTSYTGAFGSRAAFIETSTSLPLAFGTNGYEQMRITETGAIGIGTTSPESTFTIAKNFSGPLMMHLRNTGAAATSESGFIAENNGNQFLQMGITNSSMTSYPNATYLKTNATNGFDIGSASGPLRFIMGGSNLEVMRVQTSGQIGIGLATPSEMLEVNGAVRATNFVTSSDERLKKNIRPVEGLEAILQLVGVRYEWRSNDQTEIGLIAQEVEKVFPEAVVTSKVTGLKAVKYQNLVAPLINAVQELHDESQRTATVVDALRAENEALKARLDAIEAKLNAN